MFMSIRLYSNNGWTTVQLWAVSEHQLCLKQFSGQTLILWGAASTGMWSRRCPIPGPPLAGNRGTCHHLCGNCCCSWPVLTWLPPWGRGLPRCVQASGVQANTLSHYLSPSLLLILFPIELKYHAFNCPSVHSFDSSLTHLLYQYPSFLISHLPQTAGSIWHKWAHVFYQYSSSRAL